MMAKKTKKTTKINGEEVIKVSVSTIIYAFLIILVFLIATGSILAYGTNTQIGKRIAAQISEVVPFPAAIIKWNRVVYLDELEDNISSVMQYYQKGKFSDEGLRVDFTTEIGKKRLEIKKREILDKLIEDEVIMMLAKENGIVISDKEVDLGVENKLNEYGTAEQVKDDLLNSYGWTMDDFKEKVILPNMYADALAKKVILDQQGNSLAKAKIEKAQAELKSGADFADVVLKYSEGSSRENKGELGWVKKDQVIKEMADIAFSVEGVEENSIIESPIGFHIVKIEEKKKEKDEDVLRLRQVFVSKNTFADWLENKKKSMDIWVPLNQFKWEKSVPGVRFREEQMNEFEFEQRSKAQGDASLMF